MNASSAYYRVTAAGLMSGPEEVLGGPVRLGSRSLYVVRTPDGATHLTTVHLDEDGTPEKILSQTRMTARKFAELGAVLERVSLNLGAGAL